jgi:hypothetical protein
MIQYWIQIPIENAKETVNRLLADNSSHLTAYQDYEVQYSEETECIIFEIDSTFQYDFNTIYFGEIRVPKLESGLELTLSDISDTLSIFNTASGTQPGKYPYIIFNEVASLPQNKCYFYGYKFRIDAIEPEYSYLTTEDGDILMTENSELIQL